VAIRISVTASMVVAVMTLTTVYIGPGIGVEANTVTMQTCGKTLMMTLRDIVQSARHGLLVIGIVVV
jgi:hypothetical protein